MKKKKNIYLFGYGKLSEQMAIQMDFYCGQITSVYPGMEETKIVLRIKDKKHIMLLKNSEVEKLAAGEKLEKSRKFVAFNSKKLIGIVDTTSL